MLQGNGNSKRKEEMVLKVFKVFKIIMTPIKKIFGEVDLGTY